MFDDSLLIVTADHGLSFKPHDLRRPLTDTNYMDILPIPLFIKLPQQKLGAASDVNIESVDILPSIADVLGFPLDLTGGGISVFDHERLNSRVDKNVISFNGSEQRLTFSERIDEKYASVEERIVLFGEASKNFYSFSADKILIGRKVNTFPLIDPGEAILSTEENVEKLAYSKFLGPNFIRGSLSSDKPEKHDKQRIDLALAVNGVISAITKTYLMEDDGSREFLFIVPEGAYPSISNKIEIYKIESIHERTSLRRFQSEKNLVYSLSNDEKKGPIITSENDELYEVEEGRLLGYLDEIRESEEKVTFRGWAINPEAKYPASQLVLTLGGKFIASSAPKMKRPDIVSAFKESAYLKSGFNFQIELSDMSELCKGNFAVYALSKNALSKSTLAKSVVSEKGKASRLSTGKINLAVLPSC